MEGPYSFPVFFECPSLTEEQRRKIENYFHIRRKSGGGECGSVTEREEKVYSVAFKEQEAQQRVLQKSEHVVECAGGALVLTVRDNPGPKTSSHKATPTPEKSGSSKLDLTTSSQQKQQSSLLEAPNDEEYERELDLYLLRYLKESPKAGRELENRLASLSCSAQLRPDEERVLVKRLAPPGAEGEVSKWKSKVDKIFDSYMIHYELDAHRIKALLQSCSSDQSADEVKVYSEIGMAVVVGERSQVEDRLLDLQTSYVEKSKSSKSQTTVCQLGEAKLRLLWKEIEQSLKQNTPGVTVTQADEGKLMLEGSVEEILKARELISDKERLVFDRTVSDKSPVFLAFLKKAYGGPGMLGGYLGLGANVEVELQDTELHFFSFSTDKLNDANKRMEEKFKDIKYDVPNCSAVPPELREKLKSKTSEMNQKDCRAMVAFGADSSVFLLGHTKEVEELSETITQFVLDQASIEGKVHLPFPELAQCLPELLELNKFDFSGVTFHTLTSSPRPTVVLEGPSNKVTEVRNRLGPFLDSLVREKVTIDLPGAARYFDTYSGIENLLHVSNFHKCLIQLEEQPRTSRHHLGVAKYNLQHGLQVLVYEGDITAQYADAIVNAANEDLNHCGGVAAALSKAGGPDVQKESKEIVKNTGKVPVGSVVVTSGGRLKCKALLHAVGPEIGKASGREKILLKNTVSNTLNLAETMELKSIAMPCISSGVFGVPLAVCSDAIVSAVKEFGSRGGRSLSKIVLIDNKAEVVRAMREACDRLLQGVSTRTTTQGDEGVQMNEEAGGAAAGETVQVEVVQGTIENQQADVLVSPMISHDPLSTNIGNALVNVTGPELTRRFYKESRVGTHPGDVVELDGVTGLRCKTVTFLELACWDNNQQGAAVQALRRGIRKILASCENKGFGSVAFPVLGTGGLLHFPHSLAARVLLEEVGLFEQKRVSRSPFQVRVVVHPKDKDSRKAFQTAQETLHLRGFTNDVNPAKASFYRHVSATNDEVTATLGGVTLQMVCGDITHETTDIIVNTTDFKNHQLGVSKAILTAAGPTVLTELNKVGVPTDWMHVTGPGLLGCKEIVHASFNKDPQLIRKNLKKILTNCENKKFVSVAFPAINTGQAGMDFGEACKAMLDGMTLAISELKPSSLSLIRIIILQQPVFQAFRLELESRFGRIVQSRPSLKERGQQNLKRLLEKCSNKSSTSSASLGQIMSSKPQPAVLQVISCGQGIIKTIKSDLEVMLEKELLERTVNEDDIFKLDGMELDAVLAKIKVTGLSLEPRKRQGSERVNAGNAAGSGARDRSGSAHRVYVLRGLKEDVLSVIELINKAVQKALEEALKEKEEAVVALNVQWAIRDENGEWQELNLRDNYTLEQNYQDKEVSADIMTPDGRGVKVNLKTEEATDWQTGRTYKVKRSESTTDWELPSHWDPMNGKDFIKVALQPNSQEYQTVAQGFLQTAKYNIQKIERVQNVHLWRAFSVCQQRILAKNGQAYLGERFLYHGTSASSCDCIEKDRFDRNYAGTHAAVYGKGVYFALNANYSAGDYSIPDASGLKRMYVARVLTGRYTVGNSSMRAPPSRGSDPTDCFDSLVNNQLQPTIFVIFHDDQAYPEYLITFK